VKAVRATREIRAAHWRAIISEFYQSGQTVNAYCAAREVNVQSYYYRLRKLREEAVRDLPALMTTTAPLPAALLGWNKLATNEQSVRAIECASREIITWDAISDFLIVADKPPFSWDFI
jgi:hypothetical protein